MNENKIVSIISSVHNWDDTRIFKKEALSLARAGYSVNLYACGNFNFKKNDNLKIIGLPLWTKRKERSVNRKIIQSYLNKDKSSIVHFHDPELIFLGLFLKFFKGKTVIYDIHENVPQQILDKEDIPFCFRKIISLTYLCLEKITLPMFDAVITAGDDIASYYKKRITLNNYPILKNFEEHQKSLGNDYVIYVGKIQDIYGINYLCEAVEIAKKKIHKIKLLLIGDFMNERTKGKVLSYSFVEYIGWKSMAEIYQISSKCKVGIVNYLPLPNHYALRSNKVFEYMFSGLPIIYPNFKDWKEKIGIYNVGIDVNSDNPEEIADAIVFLIDNPEIAKKMGENGRRAVEEKYNWAIEERKLLNLYKELT